MKSLLSLLSVDRRSKRRTLLLMACVTRLYRCSDDDYVPVDMLPGGQPMPPLDAAATFQWSEGLQVTLAAAEPSVRQPISISFNYRRGLWVAESHADNGSKFTAETQTAFSSWRITTAMTCSDVAKYLRTTPIA